MIDPFRGARLLSSAGLTLALILSLAPPSLARPESKSRLGFETAADRIVLTHSGRPIAEFVHTDPKILRPYLANVRLPSQRQVTRRQPPVPGQDATDHADMHPGVWLAFGDIKGQDFWRNKAAIEHLRFTQPPSIADGRLCFAAESRLVATSGEVLGRMENQLTADERPHGWRLIWQATFHADAGELVFGDQEEMGFGARVATEITEKNGGTILNSDGIKTAQFTWGKPAFWCDYSGTIDGSPCGVTLLAGTTNFRGSWWHTRDYGLVVANAFGRAALTKGDKSQLKVKPGAPLELTYAVAVHEGPGYDPAAEYVSFARLLKSQATR